MDYIVGGMENTTRLWTNSTEKISLANEGLYNRNDDERHSSRETAEWLTEMMMRDICRQRGMATKWLNKSGSVMATKWHLPRV